jgi:hypothetical protein
VLPISRGALYDIGSQRSRQVLSAASYLSICYHYSIGSKNIPAFERIKTMSGILDEIKKVLAYRDGKWDEKKGVWEYSTTIAERKAFLTKKKLTYSAKMRIDDGAKTVMFFEMLVEASSGLSSGGDFDSGMSTGFGVKSESYNTFKGARQGTIEEQSRLFGKDYAYQFDYSEVRSRVKAVVEKAGYQFVYQILPGK